MDPVPTTPDANARLADLEEICDELVVIKKGSVIFSGDIAGFRKQIGAALAAAAERAGLTLGELAERLVPDAGLDVRGERQIAAGGTVTWVSIGAGWRACWPTSGPGPLRFRPGAGEA